MNRSVRHALVACLIALHATLSVGGAGLHALPGFGHNSGLHALAKNDHSHGPGKSSHEAAHECAICQFLAQGQLSCDLTAGVTSWLTIGLVTPAIPTVDFRPPYRPAAPRGPPAA